MKDGFAPIASRDGERASSSPPQLAASAMAVPRAGMRRLLLVACIMACSVIAVLISSDTLSVFCGDSSRSSSPLYQELLSRQGSGDFRKDLTIRSGADNGSPSVNDPMVKSGTSNPSYTDNGNSSINELELHSGPSCDYALGKWIKGEKKPLYSGNSCKRWLSGMWSCRLMPGRPNFEYENYRWQPEGCDLPDFDSEKFLSRMQNKVVVFVGDSIGMQQFQSLTCMLTRGRDDVAVEDVGTAYGLEKRPGQMRPDGWAHRFVQANTTLIFFWSASLCEILPLNKSDPNTHFSMNLDLPATFIQKYLPLMDVLVLNTGHHWNKGKMTLNKWIVHTGGYPDTSASFRDLGFARNYSLHKICAWLNDQLAQNRTHVQVYLRSLSPRHFFNGEWDSGGRCDDNPVPVEEKNVSGRPVADPATESAVRGTRVHLLNITYASQFRDEAHISKYRPKMPGQDCLHWCLPGVPDLWNELLYANLFYPISSGKSKSQG